MVGLGVCLDGGYQSPMDGAQTLNGGRETTPSRDAALILGMVTRIIGRMSKFEKSGINTRTEKEGISLLLRDARFQLVDLLTKRRILDLIGITGAFGTQTLTSS